jgi:hypothetical protein
MKVKSGWPPKISKSVLLADDFTNFSPQKSLRMLKIVSAINTQQQAGARAPSSARKWQNKTRAELCQILIEIGLRLESEDKLVKIRSSWTTDRSLNSTLDPSATSGRKNVSGPVMNLRLSDRSKEVTALLTIGFLIQMYKVDQWYFEIVNMIYKLLLTSVVTFLADDEPSKVAIGWIINFCFLLTIFLKQPYSSGELLLALVVMCLDLMMAMMLSTDSFTGMLGKSNHSLDNSYGSLKFQIISVFLFMLNIIVLLAPFVQMIVLANPDWLKSIRRRLSRPYQTSTLVRDLTIFNIPDYRLDHLQHSRLHKKKDVG